jgi:hypothetical protein
MDNTVYDGLAVWWLESGRRQADLKSNCRNRRCSPTINPPTQVKHSGLGSGAMAVWEKEMLSITHLWTTLPRD